MGKADTLIITKSYTIRSDLVASPYQSGAIIFRYLFSPPVNSKYVAVMDTTQRMFIPNCANGLLKIIHKL